MLGLRNAVLLGRSERGLYFPINHRIVDRRIAPEVAEVADLQSRYRRELRTSFTTGETRQTEAPVWSQKTRPTHFISLPLPVRNGLVPRVREMQAAMVFADQRVESLLIPVSKLHVTLGVMTVPELDAPQLLAAVQGSVRKTWHDVCRQPLRLRFRGMGTFGQGRVLFARCVTDGHYTSLDEFIRRFRKELGVGLGVDVKGNPHDSYVPHITLAKIRPHQQKDFGRNISAEVWAPYQHHDFGDVTFDRVDLCSMKGTGESGYYPVVSSFTVRASVT